jgi:elongation factor 1-alpha
MCCCADRAGHRDFIKNMISGAAQADVCLLMVPADGNFTTAIQKGDHKAGEIQGQTRQHARLINLLGVKQLICGVNKMDSDTAGYKEERYKEIANEMKHMLVRVGWKDSFVEKSVPILPISGWMGDNLIKKSDNMPWFKGFDVETREWRFVQSAVIVWTLDLYPRRLCGFLRVSLSGCRIGGRRLRGRRRAWIGLHLRNR